MHTFIVPIIGDSQFMFFMGFVIVWGGYRMVRRTLI